MTTVIIGRSPTAAHIVVEDTTVSGQHLELSLTGNQIVIRDLDSTNGSMILQGGRWQPLSQSTVQVDTVIRMGDFEVVINDILQAGGLSVGQQKTAPSANPVPKPAKKKFSMYVRQTDGSHKPIDS